MPNDEPKPIKLAADGCSGCSMMIIGVVGLILAFLFYAIFVAH